MFGMDYSRSGSIQKFKIFLKFDVLRNKINFFFIKKSIVFCSIFQAWNHNKLMTKKNKQTEKLNQNCLYYNMPLLNRCFVNFFFYYYFLQTRVGYFKIISIKLYELVHRIVCFPNNCTTNL